MSVSARFSELLILLQTNVVWDSVVEAVTSDKKMFCLQYFASLLSFDLTFGLKSELLLLTCEVA